jgi:hypothetical protein
MAAQTVERGGCQGVRNEHGVDWRRRLHSRLSLLAPDEEGSRGGADLWDGRSGDVSPLRVHDGNGAGYDQRADRGSTDAGHGGGLRAGGDGNGAGRSVVRKVHLPGLEDLKSAQLPDVSDGYWAAASQTIAGPAEDGLRDGDGVLDASTELERLTHRALQEAHTILDIPNNAAEDDVNGTVLRSKNAVITTALTTQAKVDENRLRRATVDRMPEILRLVEQVSKRLPPPGPIDLEAI